MNKLTRFMLVIFSALILFVAVGQGNILTRGPQAVIADEEDFDQVGPANPSEPWFDEPLIPAPVNPSEPWFDEPLIPAPAYNPPAASCPVTPDEYPQCGGDIGKDPTRTYMVTRYTDCNGHIARPYETRDLGNLGQCAQTPAPQQPTAPVTPIIPVITTQAPACPTLVNSTTCGQASYDSCVLHYEADGRARYDCKASQNPLCTGSLYCGNRPTTPAPVVPAPTASLPSCPSLVTSTFCGQPAYDRCNVSSDGTRADCYASQNPNCAGTLLCQPRTTTPAIGGTQTQTNQQAQNNHQVVTVNVPGSTIIREVPVVQSQPIAIQVASVECPANTIKSVQNNKIICTQNAPVVRLAGVVETKELPKTGLPVIAWAAAALIPMGRQLKRFNKGTDAILASNANYLWEDRQFKI